MPAPKDPIKRKIWIKNLSKANSGQKNPFYNKKHSQKTRDKISNTLQNRNPEKITTWKENISKGRIGKYGGENNPMFGRKGKENPRWKEKIHKICLVCGEPFDVVPSRKNEKCCRTKCRLKLLSERMKRPRTQEQKDKQSEFMIERYIGEKNPNFGKHFSQAIKDKISKSLSGEKNHMFGKKNPAHAERMRGKGNPNYIDGRGNEPYTLEFNKQLKAIIRRRDGYKCQKCGCPEIENNRRLDIHHIDYRKDNCIPTNLISLCFKCNIAVNYNRPHWTEYFTKRIKEIMKSPLQLHFNYEISNKEIVQSL